jgi:hypothetical protein
VAQCSEAVQQNSAAKRKRKKQQFAAAAAEKKKVGNKESAKYSVLSEKARRKGAKGQRAQRVLW